MVEDLSGDDPVYTCQDITCLISEEFVCDLAQDPICQCHTIDCTSVQVLVCDDTSCSCVETDCDSTQSLECPADGGTCYCQTISCPEGEELKWDPAHAPEFFCEAIVCDSFDVLVCDSLADPPCTCQ